MADWFIDSSIAGGNGTDPASAYPSITSVAWSAGDRAWIRKTHYEFVGNSAFIGPQSNTAVASFSQWGMTIGWPSVGDPFYDERPARGTTVGWDSDTASTAVYSLMGLNYPTLAGSCSGTAQGMFLPRGGGVFNINLQNNGTSNIEGWNNQHNQFECWIDNCAVMVNCGGYWSSSKIAFKGAAYMGKITMIFSGGSPLIANAAGASIRHLVIGSKSLVAGGIFACPAAQAHYGVVEVQTNSAQFMFDRNNTSNVANENGDGYVHIGRICGKRPWSAVSTFNDGVPCWMVDDYYGDGPLFGGYPNQPNTRVASINEAAVDIGSGAVAAMIYQVQSAVAFFSNQWAGPNVKVPTLRKYFDVTSGTAIQIRVPIYNDGTGVFSLTSGQHRAYLQAAGCNPNVCVKSTLLVGSPTKWTGSLISAGSAYLWVNTFVPAETGTVPFEVVLGWPCQASNGVFYGFKSFFGEPYKV